MKPTFDQIREAHDNYRNMFALYITVQIVDSLLGTSTTNTKSGPL